MEIENVDAETVAQVLGLSARRVQQLVKNGVIPRAKRGSYNLPDVVKSWCAWLVSGKASGDLASERRKLTAAQARIKTVEAQKAEQNVISIEDAIFAVSRVTQALVTRLEGLPGRLSSSLVGRAAGEIHVMLRNEIRQIRQSAYDDLLQWAAEAKGAPAKQRATPKKKPRRKAAP